MQTVILSLFLLVSFYETLAIGENTNFRPKHLFVRRKEPPRGSSRPHRTIYLSTDGNGSSKHSLKEKSSTRTKRSTREERSTSTHPEHTLYEFKDQHHMLVVQWSGFNFSDTVVVLSRDIVPTSKSTSYLYVSNNYGVSYKNQSHKLHYKTKDGNTKPALIETYYTSPINAKWYIFADTTNNIIFTSKDDCETLKAVNLTFTPSDIRFHASKTHGLIAYDEKTQTLYYSKDFGSTWGEREKKVISYYWGFENLDSDDILYLEIEKGDNTSKIIRGHFSHKHLVPRLLLDNVSDFEINDVYMFVTKKSKNGLDLYVGYHYHDLSVAEFPNDFRREEYFIADASENQVFVAVNHDKNTSHLYISDVTGKKYTLSMERILYFSPKQHKDHWLRRYADETFVDLYPVTSMRGVYVASQLLYGKVGTGEVYTQISENKGRSWENVDTPERYANGSLVKCSVR